MGTSKSGSVGGKPQWTNIRDGLEEIGKALMREARSIPIEPVRPSKDRDQGQSIPPSRKRGSKAGGGEGGGALTAKLRSLGKQVIQASNADRRFSSFLGDRAVKVALDELFALSAAATLRYRTRQDAPKLFQEYGMNAEEGAGGGLAKSLDKRFRKDLAEKGGRSTDNADKARKAVQRTLIEMLSPDGDADAFRKMSANQIHDALRKTNSMNIVRQFYGNYVFNAIEALVSSSHPDIKPVAEQAVLRRLRTAYANEVAKRIVKRARDKGWRSGEIPEKVDQWRDLLIEEEKAHV